MSESTDNTNASYRLKPAMSLICWKYSSGGPEPIILAEAFNVYNFSFWQRHGVKQAMRMFSRQAVKKSKVNCKEILKLKNYNDYSLYYTRRENGIAVSAILPEDYKLRVAFGFLNMVINDFHKTFAEKVWKPTTKDWELKYPKLGDFLKKADEPSQWDSLAKAQSKIDSIKEVMFRNMDHVLERGEKLGDLVKRSQDLSASSKFFYKDSKKLNRCCVLQ